MQTPHPTVPAALRPALAASLLLLFLVPGCPKQSSVAPDLAVEDDLPSSAEAMLTITRHEEARDAGSEVVPFLRHEDPAVRIAALRALGRMGQSEALGPIGFRLQDRDPVVRQEAAFALALSWGWLVDDEAAKLLLEDQVGEALAGAMETEADPQVRGAIARAMGNGAGADSWRALQRLLDEGNEDEKVAALEGMAMLGRRGIATPITGEILDPLLPALIVEDTRIQWWAAYLLVRCPLADDPEVRDRAHASLVLASTTVTDPDRLAIVARAIGAVGHDDAVTALADMLAAQPAVAVRIAAARALTKIAATKPEAPAEAATDEDAPAEDAPAEEATDGDAPAEDAPAEEASAEPPAVPDSTAGQTTAAAEQLCRLAADPDERVREVVAGGLCGTPQQPAADALLPLLSDPAGTVREAATRCLATLGMEDSYDRLEAVREDPDPWVQAARIQALATLGDERADAELAQLLEADLEPLYRLALLDALASAEHPLARSALLAALSGSSAHEAELAAVSLAPADDQAVAATLIESYGRWSDPSGAAVRRGIIHAVEGSPAIPEGWLDKALEDPDLSVRRAAARLIRGTGRHVVAHADPMPELTDPLRGVGDVTGARILTSQGAIDVLLYPREAPATVASFVALADAGTFDGLTFHRVVPNFVIQGGDPEGTGWGGPGYHIRSEFSPLPYVAGTLGMARDRIDSEGCQWFISHNNQPHLTAHYTVFGQVTQGMDAVHAVRRGDVIQGIEILRTGTPPAPTEEEEEDLDEIFDDPEIDDPPPPPPAA